MKNALDHDVDLAIRGSSCDTERWAEKESEKLGKDKIGDRKRDNEIEREEDGVGKRGGDKAAPSDTALAVGAVKW